MNKYKYKLDFAAFGLVVWTHNIISAVAFLSTPRFIIQDV